jgi:hypothetical protein
VAPPTGETMVTVCAKENVDASRTKPAAGRGKILKTTSRIVLQGVRPCYCGCKSSQKSLVHFLLKVLH